MNNNNANLRRRGSHHLLHIAGVSQVLEPLESRRLLSATASVENGVIVARGTEGADHIQLEKVIGRSNWVRITIWSNSSTPSLVKEFDRNAGGRWHGVRLDGLGGNDWIWVKRGQSQGATLSGSAGDDTLVGAEGGDALWGGSGNDRLYAGGGYDNLLVGHAGHDLLWGGGGWDRMFGGDGNDTLRGHWGGDWLNGDGGNDVLDGGEGFDWLLGGAGNDRFFVRDDTGDQVEGGPGEDSAHADFFDLLLDVEHEDRDWLR